MLTPRPRDVPTLHEAATRLWHSEAGITYASLLTQHEQRVYHDPRASYSGEQAFLRSEFQLLEAAELYWVSEEMAAVLDSAAVSLPAAPLREEDLLAPFGFVVLESPLRGLDAMNPDNTSMAVDVIEWGLAKIGGYPDLYGIVLGSYTLSSRLPPLHGHGVGSLYYLGSSTFPFEWTPEQFEGPFLELNEQNKLSMLEDRRRIQAFFLLVAQDIGVISTAPLDRAQQRRATRAGTPPPQVRVVGLHHRSHPHQRSHAGEHREVEWSHRWVVKAHWRNQWYPSQGRHIPKYILPYVKGPEDKPLRVTPTVHAWR